jgi:hypothetical protein
MHDEPEQAGYEFTGPDERGLIWLKLPNLDPKHGGQFYCVILGNDKAASQRQCVSGCRISIAMSAFD